MTDLKTLVTGLYDLLEPVDPLDRKKAIKAVMTMLGDDTSLADPYTLFVGDQRILA